MENTQDTGRRILYLDLMRIAASFFIIVLHVCSTKWKDADVFSHEWAVLNFYEAVSRWTPAVFVMISGALFLGRDIPLKKLYGKYVLRIVLAFAFWSCLYAFIYQFLPGRSPAEFAKAFISGPTHMWFLYMIAALYMVTPILKKIAHDDRLTEYFIILALLFRIMTPQTIGIIRVFSASKADWVQSLVYNFHMQLVMGYSVYYLLGYRLSRISISKKIRRLLFAAGAAGFIVTVFGSSLIAHYRGEALETLYNAFTFNVFFEAVFVFVLFRSLFESVGSSLRARSIISRLSEYCFGIFLVHILVINTLNNRFGINCLPFEPVICVPLLSLLVFILSCAISAVLHCIPFVKKHLV